VPSASTIKRSLLIEVAALRTTIWAWVIAQGAAFVQLLPAPFGEA
jgi:hypothetical protein